MSKLEIRELIRASIIEEKLNRREEFRALGSGKKRYTEEQKEYAINKAQEIGVRATARLLQLYRKTIQIKQSENVGRNVVDNFETAMQRIKKDEGYIVAFSFGKGAYEEVARVKQDGLFIKLLTVDKLLEFKEEAKQGKIL
ncbi:hypothetical protein ES703_13535 [subsurface metagenome]